MVRREFSVGQLQTTTDLGRPRLVVLSACENRPGRYHQQSRRVHRPPRHLHGARRGRRRRHAVAGDDTATALLMARFYELHIGERLPPASALSRAQAWLRDATNTDLQAYVENAVVSARLAPHLGEQIVQELSAEGLRRCATVGSRSNGSRRRADLNESPRTRRTRVPLRTPTSGAASCTPGFSPSRDAFAAAITRAMIAIGSTVSGRGPCCVQ